MREFLWIVCGFGVGAGVCAPAAAQRNADTYPDRPLRFIVPFAPGGGNDILARAVGAKLTEAWGQQVVIDNRGGAGGNIAGELAARSVPDGYTLFMLNSANLIAPSLYRKLAYDPSRDFAPVTLIASSAFVIVLHPDVPVRSVNELIALAKAKPGTLTFASGGNGAATHLAAEQLAQVAGIKLVHVPYKGAGPAFVDLLAGQVTMYFSSLPPAVPHVKAGRVRALAVTSARRARALPDLPTVMEAGVPDYEATVTYGMVTTAKTPAAIIGKLHAQTVRVLNLPDVRERLAGQGADLVAGTPAEYRRDIELELARWARVVKASGARAD
jgi:tripartite-type tricarboxylate transporter receptor subunit TctC